MTMPKDADSVWNDLVPPGTADGKAQKQTRMSDYQKPKAFAAQSQKGDPFFHDRIRRIMETTGAKTQSELAAVIDTSQSTISDSCRRHSIPAEWYVKLMEIKGLNPMYLKWGIEPIFLMENRSDMAPIPMPLHHTALPLIKMLFRAYLPQPLAELALSKLYIDKERLSERLPDILAEFLPGDLARIVAANILDKGTE